MARLTRPGMRFSVLFIHRFSRGCLVRLPRPGLGCLQVGDHERETGED